MGLFKSKEQKEMEKIAKRMAEIDAENQKNGDKFEEKTRKALSKGFGVPVAGNVILKNNRGNMLTEIDGLFVTRKGIFCLECKYHKDVIFVQGDLVSDWTTNEYNGVENPIPQNEHHINILRPFIREDIPIINLIAMSSKIKLVYFGKLYENDAYFIKNKMTGLIGMASGKCIKELKELTGQLPDVLSDSEVNEITSHFLEWQATEEERAMYKQRMIERESAF